MGKQKEVIVLKRMDNDLFFINEAAVYSFFRVKDIPTAFGPELDATAAPI